MALKLNASTMTARACRSRSRKSCGVAGLSALIVGLSWKEENGNQEVVAGRLLRRHGGRRELRRPLHEQPVKNPGRVVPGLRNGRAVALGHAGEDVPVSGRGDRVDRLLAGEGRVEGGGVEIAADPDVLDPASLVRLAFEILLHERGQLPRGLLPLRGVGLSFLLRGTAPVRGAVAFEVDRDERVKVAVNVQHGPRHAARRRGGAAPALKF